MYTFPSYASYYEKDGSIYLTSAFHQNLVRLYDPSIQEEFWKLLDSGGCNDLDSTLAKFLHEQKLLVSSEEFMQVINRLRQTINESLLITIMPTESCNFRCPYCYENHSPIFMSREILSQIHQYITQQASRFKYIHISWFGGEPTLCKDHILETSNLVKKLNQTLPFRYTSSMTTNGYLLGLEQFKQYYLAGITTYQVTLDGWNHDKTRPHVSGKGTLEKILENLIEIAALNPDEYQYKIILRHNILSGDEDFSWYDHLHSLFGNDNRFAVMVYPVSDWGGESVRSLKILEDENEDMLIKRHIDYLSQISMPCTNNEEGMLSKICYASYPNGFVFRSNGKIEKCTTAFDHPRNLVGYVEPNRGVVLNDVANNAWCTSELKPACYHCADVLSCLNLKCRKSLIIDNQEGSQCSGMC